LETAEVDILSSYYQQDGSHAAVTGGIGSEKLTDATGAIVISIPLSADNILKIDGGISAYTSASSSNINPFDGRGAPDAFQASSGASSSDIWGNGTVTYSHSSDDRNDLWSAKLSASTEFDYVSFGFGGSYAKLFNEKNTEISVDANAYLDQWNAIYPYELRPFLPGGNGLRNRLFAGTLSENTHYAPRFTPFSNVGRNSYSLGLGLSQIISQRLQGSMAIDFVKQQGLLSTPFQRVYFSDVAGSFIDGFHLADDVERLPNSRFKVALGGRMNFYINEQFVLRTYYRYYFDDWGIRSHTASIEVPIKITDQFTIYPSYRFYNQTAADYFAPFDQHISTESFYTSDYDLSGYKADQYGFGISYTDIFTKRKVGPFGLKSIDLKYNNYQRNTNLNASIISAGVKFTMD
jgi:hypothetical protein